MYIYVPLYRRLQCWRALQVKPVQKLSEAQIIMVTIDDKDVLKIMGMNTNFHFQIQDVKQ